MNYRLIAFTALLFLLPVISKAESKITWQDRSQEIPQTVLDEHISSAYLSFSASRGDEWLVGNPNQLLQVLPDKTINLTPQLSDIGYKNIRQVASDGEGWLIIGDSSIWLSESDLAFRYDGMYWKNVSHILTSLPAQEWLGTVIGKHGIWIIPTEHHLYMWHEALNEPAIIPLPDALNEPRVSPLSFNAVREGWIVDFVQQNGPKSIVWGSPQYDKRFFFFDGQNFQEITSKLGSPSIYSALGSNGNEILLIGAITSPKDNTFQFVALRTDGQKIINVTRNFRYIFSNNLTLPQQPFLTQSRITWNGKTWILIDQAKNCATFDNTNPVASCGLTKDTFLNLGYGLNGKTISVGFAKNQQNQIIPRLVELNIK